MIGLPVQVLFSQPEGREVPLAMEYKIHSKQLDEERVIWVRVPHGYETSKQAYPVVYKLFGTNETYFSNIHGTMKLLAGEGIIPQMILVGLDQTSHAEMVPKEFSDQPDLRNHAEQFLPYLAGEVIPFIEKNFRTQPMRIFMGSYDCGAFGIYVMLHQPMLFYGYLLNSPGRYGGATSFIAETWNKFDQIKEFRNFLYITDAYTDEGEMSEETMKLVRYLSISPYQGLEFDFDDISGPETDGYTPYYYSKGFLKKMFRDYKCPVEKFDAGLDAVKAHYAGLSLAYGYPIDIPERMLDDLGNHLWRNGKTKSAEEVFLEMHKNYPSGINACLRLGDLYTHLERFKEAAEYYKEGLELGPNITVLKVRYENAIKNIK